MPVDHRELYETDDENYLAFVSAVVELTVNQREEAAEEAKSR